MLQIKNLTKKYKGEIVLNQFSLDANIGECIGIVGQNGAGKTTLFNLICDILLPDSGEILYNKENIINNYPNSLKQKLGVFLGGDTLIDEMNCYEYLDFISSLYLKKGKSFNESNLELISYFFEDHTKLLKPISEYSYGMKQKLNLIAAIIHNPQLIVLDEPFNGLDIISVKKLIDLLQKIQPHCLIFLSSHNLNYLNDIVTKMVVLEKGETLFKGEKDVFNNNGIRNISDSLIELIKPNYDDISNGKWMKNYE